MTLQATVTSKCSQPNLSQLKFLFATCCYPLEVLQSELRIKGSRKHSSEGLSYVLTHSPSQAGHLLLCYEIIRTLLTALGFLIHVIDTRIWAPDSIQHLSDCFNWQNSDIVSLIFPISNKII